MNLAIRHFFHRDKITLYAPLFLRTFRYVFGLDAHWCDARPALIAIGITRICLFLSIAWVNWIVGDAMLNGDVATFAQMRAEGNYTPFGLLMLFGDKPPSAVFWVAVQYASWISTCMAIIGLATRSAMIISTLSVLLLVLLDASVFIAWSHPYNVIFLCALPFMFAPAGQSFSVDAWITKRMPNYLFAPKALPVFWAVLAVQYSAALFYFGAFWAKLVVSNGGIDYIFSDSMRNILAVTWYGYVEMATPSHVDFIASNPWLWKLVAAIHLLMQAIVVMVVFAVHKPHIRLFEGIAFAVSCIGLYVLMSVSDPWWLLLVPAFIDWDYYLPRLRKTLVLHLGGAFSRAPSATPETALNKPLLLVAGLVTFYGVYCISFLSQKADEMGIYPFSDMNMYAAVYAMKPYNQHLPYVDIMRGNITIELPDTNWSLDMKDGRWIRLDQLNAVTRERMLPKISRKATHDVPVLISKQGQTIHFLNIPDTYPLLARETNMDKLQNSLRLFLKWLAPLPEFPAGSRLVLRGQTVAFSAYPAPAGKKEIFHSGIRAVYDFTNDVFVGASPTLDYATRRIQLNGKGITKRGSILASSGVLEVPKPEPYVEVKGKWIDENTFEIDRSFFKDYESKVVNILIEAETDLGTFAFDGPTVQW